MPLLYYIYSRYPHPKSLPSGEGLRRRSGGAGLQALSLRSLFGYLEKTELKASLVRS